jgi:salicylate hydroxylase
VDCYLGISAAVQTGHPLVLVIPLSSDSTMSPSATLNASPTSHTSDGSSFRNRPNYPIAIVGGGLGGLALAIGLLKHGIHVHIYEAAAAFAEIGAGVAFGPNSTRALALIDPMLIEGYKKHATFNEDRDRDHTFMSIRWGMDETGKDNENGAKAGDLMWHLEDKWAPEGATKLGVRTRSCIHRARLLDVLVSLLPSGIASFGKSFESLDEQPDGTLKLHFEDGTTAMASAVIGCDGIKSKVRSYVCGSDVEATYVGEYAYRAMVPKAEAEKALGAELARNGQLYCGYGAYIVTYPVEHGEFTNMVAVPHDTGDEWTWNHQDWTVPATTDELVRKYQGWVPALIDVFKRHCQPMKWALFNLQHAAPYFKGRVCLLGDSAHAATPHLGAGAGMAMEDAYILSNLIVAVKGSDDIESAFRAYDKVRRPRTQKLIELSRLSGLAIEFLMPGVGDDVGTVREKCEEWYQWLWHEDLEAQLETAIGLL